MKCDATGFISIHAQEQWQVMTSIQNKFIQSSTAVWFLSKYLAEKGDS